MSPFGSRAITILPRVHRLGELEAARGLAEHEPRGRGAEQGAELVLQGRQALGGEAGAEARKLVLPERPHRLVAAERHHPGAILAVGQHPLHRKQAHVAAAIGVIQDRRHGAEQDVFRPGAPGVRPEVPEDRHDVGRDQRPVLLRLALEDVEADRPRELGRVEIDHVRGAPGRHVIEQPLGLVPVRVDEETAPPGLDVLDQHVAQQGRFADAGLAEQQHVLAPVGDREAERRPVRRHGGQNLSLANEDIHTAKPASPALAGAWAGRRENPPDRPGSGAGFAATGCAPRLGAMARTLVTVWAARRRSRFRGTNRALHSNTGVLAPGCG